MTANSPQTVRPAGDFSQWLAGVRSGTGGDVPCGDCNACCRSSYFIHIRADESRTLAAIPEILRFAAPTSAGGAEPDDQLMGFSDQGSCPMLQDDICTIYPDRPQTCRDYDCRIFTACGIDAGDQSKRDVNAQVTRWRFDYPTPEDHNEQRALTAAIQFLQQEYRRIGLDQPLSNPIQMALLAIRISELFLTETTTDLDAIADQIRLIMDAPRT